MDQVKNKNIRTLSLEELQNYFETLGEKKFRVKQVWEWLWQKHAHSFDDMTNLSKELRQTLSQTFSLPAIRVDISQYSSDGTIKTRFKTHDNHLTEGVLIPVDNRQTACVSSRSEEHTSELQSRQYLECGLLLEKKKDAAHQPDMTPHTMSGDAPRRSARLH